MSVCIRLCACIYIRLFVCKYAYWMDKKDLRLFRVSWFACPLGYPPHPNLSLQPLTSPHSGNAAHLPLFSLSLFNTHRQQHQQQPAAASVTTCFMNHSAVASRCASWNTHNVRLPCTCYDILTLKYRSCNLSRVSQKKTDLISNFKRRQQPERQAGNAGQFLTNWFTALDNTKQLKRFIYIL